MASLFQSPRLTIDLSSEDEYDMGSIFEQTTTDSFLIDLSQEQDYDMGSLLQETHPFIDLLDDDQTHPFIDLLDDDDDDVVEIVNPNPTKRFRRSPPETESESDLMCVICAETKASKEFFNLKGCYHLYCSDCMMKYVVSKIQDNITSIKCPEPSCQAVLEPELCRSILPKEVFDRWCTALCESLFLGSQKFYCPFKDCSALLINDGEKVVTESYCPHCKRLFCAQCKVSWHSGMSCQEFQKSSENDKGEEIKLMKLAMQRKWQRCPSCKFFVQRNTGCKHISCRCGNQFCYSCGARWDGVHQCTKYSLVGSSDFPEMVPQVRSNQRKCSRCREPGHDVRSCRMPPPFGSQMRNQRTPGSSLSQASAPTPTPTPTPTPPPPPPSAPATSAGNANTLGHSMTQSAHPSVGQSVIPNASLSQSLVEQTVRAPLQMHIPLSSPLTQGPRTQQLLPHQNLPLTNLTAAQQQPSWVRQTVSPSVQSHITLQYPIQAQNEVMQHQSTRFYNPNGFYPTIQQQQQNRVFIPNGIVPDQHLPSQTSTTLGSNHNGDVKLNLSI